MTKSILTFLGVIVCNLLLAQQFKPSIISSGGGFMSNANAKITFTIGEPVSGNIQNSSAKFAQGFQQNWIDSGTGISEIGTDNSIVVYPNPTSDFVNIKFEKSVSENSIVELVDINGKSLLLQEIKSNKTETVINLSNYPESIYFIKISTQSGKLLGTYKIQIKY